MKKYNVRLALRLSLEQREKIETLISKGAYKNLSQVIRAALDDFRWKGGEKS